MQEITEINFPVTITIPEDVIAPTFFLEVPFPDDAEFLGESKFVVMFIRPLAKVMI